MLAIPLTDSNDQIFDIALDTQVVNIRMHWNKLQRTWMLTVRYGDDHFIIERVVTSRQRLVRDFRLFGDIMAVPLRENILDPGRWAWDRTHELVFVNDREILLYQSQGLAESLGVPFQDTSLDAPLVVGESSASSVSVSPDLTVSRGPTDVDGPESNFITTTSLDDERTAGVEHPTLTPEFNPYLNAAAEFIPTREAINEAAADLVERLRREPVSSPTTVTSNVRPTPNATPGFATPDR